MRDAGQMNHRWDSRRFSNLFRGYFVRTELPQELLALGGTPGHISFGQQMILGEFHRWKISWGVVPSGVDPSVETASKRDSCCWLLRTLQQQD